MVKKLYTESSIENIAAAIRAKNHTNNTYKVAQMASAIQALPEPPIIPVGTKFRGSTGDLATFLNGCDLSATATQTDFSYMFSECTALTTVPLFSMESATVCNYMFNGCTSLTSVPLLDTSHVTDPGAMFNGCSSLVDLPQLDFSSATVFGTVLNMHKIFYGCTSLSNASLNNILASMTGATAYTGTKTLKFLGLTSDQSTTCTGLSNYTAFTNAGWSTGY